MSSSGGYAGKGEEGKWWSWSNYGIGIDFPGGEKELEGRMKKAF